MEVYPITTVTGRTHLSILFYYVVDLFMIYDFKQIVFLELKAFSIRIVKITFVCFLFLCWEIGRILLRWLVPLLWFFGRKELVIWDASELFDVGFVSEYFVIVSDGGGLSIHLTALLNFFYLTQTTHLLYITFILALLIYLFNFMRYILLFR